MIWKGFEIARFRVGRESDSVIWKSFGVAFQNGVMAKLILVILDEHWTVLLIDFQVYVKSSLCDIDVSVCEIYDDFLSWLLIYSFPTVRFQTILESLSERFGIGAPIVELCVELVPRTYRQVEQIFTCQSPWKSITTVPPKGRLAEEGLIGQSEH